MIRVEALRYIYPALSPDESDLTALGDLSFHVDEGESVAITGSNNAGKTTLLLALAGLAPRLTVGSISGKLIAAGHDVQAENPGALADLIGLVMQDPTGQLFNATLEEEIAWGLENLGLPRSEMVERIDQAVRDVGLEDVPYSQPPGTLSGGQQKRLALAAALALRPKILLLDEPAGGLAPAGRAEMIAVLHRLRQEEGLTLVFTENDPGLIAALADRVLILEEGRIIAQGTPRDLFFSRSLPGVSLPPAGAFAHEVNDRRSLDLTCLTLEEAVAQTQPFSLNGSCVETIPKPAVTINTTQPPAIQIDQLSFAYDPARPILQDLNLTIPQGQFIALTGDNGAGKTTLVRHLVGLLRPVSGTVSLFGENSDGRSIGQLARQVGFAFQNPEVQIFNPTVREECAFGPRNIGLKGVALKEAVSRALGLFQLEAVADYPPAELSFSTRRLVALASVAAMETPIIVLDEPTVGLDSAGQALVFDWLLTRHRANATVILITHNMELAARHAERALILHEGAIVVDGMPYDVFLQVDDLNRAGLESPFAMGFASALGLPQLATDLTPQGAARAWLDCLL